MSTTDQQIAAIADAPAALREFNWGMAPKPSQSRPDLTLRVDAAIAALAPATLPAVVLERDVAAMAEAHYTRRMGRAAVPWDQLSEFSRDEEFKVMRTAVLAIRKP